MSMTQHDLDVLMAGIWRDPPRDAGEEALRLALLTCALDICHEVGTQEATDAFVIATVREFLRRTKLT